MKLKAMLIGGDTGFFESVTRALPRVLYPILYHFQYVIKYTSIAYF